MRYIVKGEAPLKRFLILFIISFSPLFLAAQINSKVDNGQDASPVQDKPDTLRNGDDIFNVVKVGVIIPQGQFAQPFTYPGGNINNFSDLALPFKGIGGIGAKPGFNLQYEGFSSLWRIKSSKAPVAHFGLQYGFDFGYIPVNWTNVNWGSYNMSVETNPFIFTGFKLGPALYFNPVKDMGIGIYALLDGFLTAPGAENASYTADISNVNTVAIYDVKDSNNVHYNLEESVGLNIYYKAIIIGVEYDWIHTQYYGSVEQVVTQTQSNGAESTITSYFPFNNTLHMNLIKFTVGVRLGYGRRSSRDKFDE